MLDSIKESFTESIQIQIAAAEALPDAITHAAQAMVATLLNGNKILCCGNGGSASNAQQFVSCLLEQIEHKFHFCTFSCYFLLQLNFSAVLILEC